MAQFPTGVNTIVNKVEQFNTQLDDAFDISTYEGSAIKVSAIPHNQSTIKPLRNHILRFDIDKSKSQGTLDTQNTPTVL